MSDSDRERLVNALETVAEVMGHGELETLRKTIEGLEDRLAEGLSESGKRLDAAIEELKAEIGSESRRSTEAMSALDERLGAGIEQAGQAAQAAIDGVRSDFETRFDQAGTRATEISETGNRRVEALGERVDRVAADLEERIDRAEGAFRDDREQLKQRVEQVETEVDRRVEDRVAAVETAVNDEREARKSFDAKIDQLSRAFSEIQSKFTEQMETSQKLSGLLTNLETVFSAQKGVRQSVPAESRAAGSGAARPDDKEKTDGEDAPQMSSNELDNALNNLFQGS
jgi:DNA repair exonuclease SbcCD ATPase subunit